jgi:SAM-dependent methyltransferase
MPSAAHQPVASCPVCGNAGREHLFAKDGWPVVRCDACRLVFVDAVVDRDVLERIYGRDYYEGDVFADYLGEAEERIASGRARAAQLRTLVPGGRLLDLGCAAGFFLLAASEYYDVAGVEVSAYASQHARDELGLRVYTGEIFDAPLADAEFDVVTMWDVVEHLADPARVLAEVARVTRPGGLLVLTTGNVEGPLAHRDLERWDLMCPPAHLQFFSPATLERLLNRAGFQIERMLADGRVSTRPRLSRRLLQRVLGTLGVGNVITVVARRTTQPRRRPFRARMPGILRAQRRATDS